MRSIAAIALLACGVAFAACGGVSASPVPSVPSDLASPVTGVVIDVDAKGLTDVTGFTLRTADGTEIPFLVGTLENAVEFPPSHLAAHLADAFPVRVSFRRDARTLVAYRLEDASTASS